MRLSLAAGGVLLLVLLTWLALRGINTNASAYAETQRALDDFALAEASISRDVLQARAGLLGNYDFLGEAEEAMENAVSRIKSRWEAEKLDPNPVDRLAAALGQYEDLTERFKSSNSLLQNSLSYVSQSSTDPAFGALGDQFASSATALAAAVLHLALDSSVESAGSLQQQINRFEAQAPTGGPDGEEAHALLAHARLLRDLLPEVDQTLRAIVATPGRQPLEESRELLASAQAASEITAQRFRIVLSVVSLVLLVLAFRLGLRLRTRTQKIRRLVDANIIGIVIGVFRGRIIDANDAFLQIVGYERNDITTGMLRWTELTPPEWRDGDEQRVAELKVTGVARPYEKEFLKRDGSRVPVLIGAAIFDKAQDQGVAFVLDLTERKRAERALRESEAKFRDYAETASDWLWEVGPDYKFTLLTENAFGSDPAARIGTTCWDHALDLETEPEKWRLAWETLDARKPFRDFVYCSVGGDGPPMYVKASGKPVFDANGEFRGYRGTGTDVTAIMRAQHAEASLRRELQRSQFYLSEGQRLVHMGSWAFNPSGFFDHWSDELFRIYGLDPQKGNPTLEQYLALVHPQDRDFMAETIKRMHAQRCGCDVKKRIIRPDGELRYIRCVGIPVIEYEVLKGFLGTAMDVTEQERLRQLEADLAHMNRLGMMGELAASLAHEITQPIASARNNARAALNFLDQQPPDLGEVREALGCVVGDADRAGNIVDRIREHIKKAPLRKERFDLNAAINEVIVLAHSAITENGVSVRTRLADGLFPVQGDCVQVQQVILNLVLNAVEAMGSVEAGARELVISTEQTKTGGALVAVRDSGPGIDTEHLERVFQAFYTTKPSGTGMGLSICRSIIDAHGGRMWAEANVPRGTVFQFTLPGVEASSSGGSPNARAA